MGRLSCSVAKRGHCHRDCRPCKAANIYFLALDRKGLPAPDNTTYYRHHLIKKQLDTEKVNTVSPERRPILNQTLTVVDLQREKALLRCAWGTDGLQGLQGPRLGQGEPPKSEVGQVGLGQPAEQGWLGLRPAGVCGSPEVGVAEASDASKEAKVQSAGRPSVLSLKRKLHRAHVTSAAEEQGTDIPWKKRALPPYR